AAALAEDDGVALFPLLDQPRDRLRRVLEVAVDQHHAVAAGVVDPGSDRRLVAEVARQLHQLEARVLLVEAADDVAGAVGAAVVDEHRLPVIAGSVECLGESAAQLRQVLPLVEDRHDNRDHSPHVAILLDSIFHVWRTQMGDPDALGWTTTVAYLVAAGLCARTALAARRGPPDAPPGDRPGPWWLLSAGLLVLGLNKQLDLQILVRELGIRFIDLLGMEAQRRWFGRAFVLLMAIFLLRVMREAVRQMRGH